MGFESVKTVGPLWRTESSGSKKGGNFAPKACTPQSFMVGHYLESKTMTINDQQSTLHTFKFTSCGNEADLTEPIGDDGKVSVWGNGVLNDLIDKNVQPGQLCKVQWLGSVISKQTGNPYHNYDLLIDRTAEPLSMSALPAELQKAAAAPVANATPAQQMEDDDSDLPF
jgi:hypothetical protein